MIPIWELWPFTVYPWYGVCRRSLWSCPEKPWWKLSHTQAAFSLFCHLDPTSLFPGSSKNQPHWPLIHLFRFFSLLFNHLSPHLYLPSDSFSLQDGQSFSTSLPYVQFLSHLLNHFYYSLTVHSDNRVTRADGLVYEGRGSLSFIPLPSLSQPTLFVKPEGMQSPSLSDVPKSCVADSQPLLSVRSCHFFSTQDCGGLVPMCLVCHTLSSIDSVMEWPLQLCRGWEWGSCDRCSLDVCCWSCQLAVPEPWTRTTQLLRMTAEWPLDFSLRSTLPLMTRITEEIHTDRSNVKCVHLLSEGGISSRMRRCLEAMTVCRKLEVQQIWSWTYEKGFPRTHNFDSPLTWGKNWAKVEPSQSIFAQKGTLVCFPAKVCYWCNLKEWFNILGNVLIHCLPKIWMRRLVPLSYLLATAGSWWA